MSHENSWKNKYLYIGGLLRLRASMLFYFLLFHMEVCWG